MISYVIDGKILSKKIKKEIFYNVRNLVKNGNRVPLLSIVLVGNNYSSHLYINNIKQYCNEIGFLVVIYYFPYDVIEVNILDLINQLNFSFLIDAILIQMPLPRSINNKKICEKVIHNKDVDCINPFNIGKLFLKRPFFIPCTQKGIFSLINYYNIKICGLNALVLGKSNIVGKPISFKLLLSGCNVTLTNILNINLKFLIKKSDLIIVALGKAKFLKGSWIKKGSIVIDVGINKLINGVLVGDVDYYSSLKKTSYITPVPGGIGPMTVASLMQNIYKAYKHNNLIYK
ncbi:MAG: bifunctional 5,10-methylenetetrahydrofolate dehydrogenase/5,10-methenyltetrahydrofolate cyclohydrolase [Candidatus Makana argininalis]